GIVTPDGAGVGSCRPDGALARPPFRRQPIRSEHAGAEARSTRPVAIEAWMLVAGLGRPQRANADGIDDVVGLSVAIVVEVRTAVARTRGAGGWGASVAARHANSSVQFACLCGRRRSRRLDSCHTCHIAGIETSNVWTTLRGFRRWRESDSRLIVPSAGAGSRIVPLRSERRTIDGFAPPRPS